MCSVFRISILLFFVPFASQAATSHARPVHTKPIVYSRNAYAASVISVFSPATIAAGSTSRLQVTFHNLGAAPWYTSGNSYVSLYHWNPHTKLQTVSPFATNGWRTTQQPTVLRKTTLHGQDVTFDVPLRAPTVPGTYHESFILAAEHVAWIKLSPFTIDLQVTPSTFTDSVVNTNSLPTPALVASTSPTSNAPIATAPPTFPSDNSWSAEVVSKGGMEWQIDPQSSASVEFTFKNTGMHTWYSDGKNFISLYATSSTHERSSPFAASSWIGPTHVARLKESSVAPGQIGHVDLTLQAPADPGQFSETFTLAAENTSWIQGSSVSLPILVPATLDFIASGIPNDVDIDAQPQTTPSTSQTSGLYVSTRVLSSADRVALAGNRRQGLSFAFKNTGTATWTSLSVRVKILSNADITTAALVHDPSWYSSSQPVYLLGTTYPGQVGYVAFQVKAPTLKGTYQAHFQLYANEQPVDGGEIDIPVSVTADGRPIPSQPSQPSAPSTPSPSLPILTPSAPIVPPQPLNGNLAALLAEPIIRVGIYTPTDDQMVVRAMSVPVIVSINNAEVCRFQPGQLVTVRFDRTTNLYQLTSGPCSGSSSQVYRFQTRLFRRTMALRGSIC